MGYNGLLIMQKIGYTIKMDVSFKTGIYKRLYCPIFCHYTSIIIKNYGWNFCAGRNKYLCYAYATSHFPSKSWMHGCVWLGINFCGGQPGITIGHLWDCLEVPGIKTHPQSHLLAIFWLGLDFFQSEEFLGSISRNVIYELARLFLPRKHPFSVSTHISG